MFLGLCLKCETLVCSVACLVCNPTIAVSSLLSGTSVCSGSVFRYLRFVHCHFKGWRAENERLPCVLLWYLGAFLLTTYKQKMISYHTSGWCVESSGMMPIHPCHPFQGWSQACTSRRCSQGLVQTQPNTSWSNPKNRKFNQVIRIIYSVCCQFLPKKISAT